MTVHSGSELHWVKNSLWNKDEYILAIVPDSVHKHMFWIKWPDQTQSVDYYNIAHAKDNAVKYTLGLMNSIAKKTSTEPVGAFK